MKRTFFLILVMAALTLSACGARAAATQVPSMNYGAGGAAPMPEESGYALPAQKPDADGRVLMVDATTSNPAGQERIVIQNANLTIVVKDPQVKMLEIGAMAQRLGGFVVSSNMGKTPIADNLTVSQGTISIRVPAKDLDAALDEIKKDTVEIQNENRSGQDVTDQYVDLQSQLKAKQAAEAKLYEILQKTEKAEDTLMVFNQLTQIQSEIEVLKGQINYYEQASALSEVTVTVLAEETIQPLQIGGWQPQGEVRDAVQALIKFFQGFINFLIWLVIFIIPVAAVIIALLAVLWRLLRWFWRKVFPKKTPPPAAPPAPAA